MKKIVVVIPSYNNSKWYQKNILSVLSQDYQSYRVVYTDDCSSDQTGKLVEQFIEKHGLKDRFQLILNSKRIGAMENLYKMIHSCDDEEIIVTLDGDDWFAHPHVLSKIAKIYADPNVWITWGQYMNSHDRRSGCSAEIPADVLQNQNYRNYRWCTSHLRTFYAWLFKKINIEDFYYQGKFMPMGWDVAMYCPMIEMAGFRSKFINDILYVYNTENPINDHKVNIELQRAIDAFVRTKTKYQLL